MSETTQVKAPVRNLERVQEKKFATYEEATAARTWATKLPVHKIKVFRRSDGTFDVVWYKLIGAPVKVAQAPEKAPEVKEQAVHGLKSKDRKKSPKKAR